MSITVSLKREFFSFCGNVTQYTVKNSHFCFKRAWSCGESIQLFFNATQWEANRTTRYVVVAYIIGDAGWEFSGASHEIYSSHFGCPQFIWWAIARTRIFFNIKNPTTRCFSPFPFARLYFQFLLCSIFWGKFPSPLLTPLKNNGPSTMNIRRKIYRSSVWNKTQQMFSWRKKGT